MSLVSEWTVVEPRPKPLHHQNRIDHHQNQNLSITKTESVIISTKTISSLEPNLPLLEPTLSYESIIISTNPVPTKTKLSQHRISLTTPDFVLLPSVSTTSVALCNFEHLLLSPRRYIVVSTVNVYLSPPDEGKGNLLETSCLFIVSPVSSQGFLLYQPNPGVNISEDYYYYKKYCEQCGHVIFITQTTTTHTTHSAPQNKQAVRMTMTD